MSLFFLFLGIILLIIGIVCAVNAGDSYDWEDLWIGGGVVGIFAGIVMIIVSIVGLCGGLDKKETSKTEVISTDSTQVHIVPDSIYAIQYIISWKDENEIKCGQNVILKGKTEKNVGDTIIIDMK